jgi:hypothetical protein
MRARVGIQFLNFAVLCSPLSFFFALNVAILIANINLKIIHPKDEALLV